METRERILTHANQLFMKYGARSVTLDDVARDLGISKKTIYQYFENKEDIVCEVTRNHMRAEEEAGNRIAGISENALDELARFIQHTIQSLKTISPQLIFETQKYYPQAWQIFHDHKNDYILSKVRENLERGIREGLYRADIHVEIVARMRVAQIEMSLDPALFPPDQFDFVEIQLQMIELYMFGVMTKKGRAYLSEHRYHREAIQLDPNSFL
jgi:TetR/AcrR family transcriptional regulator, cholesterol catabolism regulator